jgi:hypothetical protein
MLRRSSGMDRKAEEKADTGFCIGDDDNAARRPLGGGGRAA